MCDKLLYSTRPSGDYDNTDYIDKILDGGNYIYFIGLPKTVTTLEEAKTYLGNIEIQYELATEVIESYTEEQQEQYNKIKELYTFDGTTNIYSDDNVPPYLKIQYYMKEE